MPRNWLSRVPNPFNLAGPPAWFLTEMAALDPDLVIFPSQEEGVYRLARRTSTARPYHYLAVQHRPDTHVYEKYRLFPVTSILPAPLVQWSPVLLKDLAERDMWRFGGADKVAKALDDREAEDEARRRRTTLYEAEDLGSFTWNALKWRNGERIDLGSQRRHGAGRRTEPVVARQPVYRPLNSDSMFVGRPDLPARNGSRERLVAP